MARRGEEADERVLQGVRIRQVAGRRRALSRCVGPSSAAQTSTSILDVLSVGGAPGFWTSRPGRATSPRPPGSGRVGRSALIFSPAMVAQGTLSDFVLGDAERLPFADRSFDAVGMNFGILHLGDPQAAIREAFRVLVGGGRFAFTVWADPAGRGGSTWCSRPSEPRRAGERPAGPGLLPLQPAGGGKTALAAAGFTDATVTTVDLAWSQASSTTYTRRSSTERHGWAPCSAAESRGAAGDRRRDRPSRAAVRDRRGTGGDPDAGRAR